jgi:cell division FtsZ-interacting protein ZapD
MVGRAQEPGEPPLAVLRHMIAPAQPLALDRQREALGNIVTIPSHRVDGAASAVRQDAKAVVLDLVNPTRTGRRPRQARLIAGSSRLVILSGGTKRPG